VLSSTLRSWLAAVEIEVCMDFLLTAELRGLKDSTDPET
jgi:hypothetical protein